MQPNTRHNTGRRATGEDRDMNSVFFSSFPATADAEVVVLVPQGTGRVPQLVHLLVRCFVVLAVFPRLHLLGAPPEGQVRIVWRHIATVFRLHVQYQRVLLRGREKQ